jgi:hypothetical protein
MPKIDRSDGGPALAKPWVIVVGAAMGVLTLIFFMGLVLLGTAGHQVPCDSRYLVSVTLSLGAALSAAFLGGSASARGAFPVPFLRDKPMAVSASGGVAVLIVMLVLTHNLHGTAKCDNSVSVSCPVGFQPYNVDTLRFAFCYPREGWEVDAGAIGVRAADIYLRKSGNHDIGVHFHIALVPAGWAGKPDSYTDNVAATWRQLDAQLSTSKSFIGGRDAYGFALKVRDRQGRSRPTEIFHIYLDRERIIEIISTWFDETPVTVIDDIKRVRSTIVFART